MSKWDKLLERICSLSKDLRFIVCICCPKTMPRRQDRPWRWQRISAFSVMIGSGPCSLGHILWSLLCVVAQTHDGIQENECAKNSCIFESGAV